MTVSHEQRLRDLARALGLAWHDSAFARFEGDRKEEYARMIVAAHIIADESRQTLGDWIDAGRRAGMSWVEVGALLGISKQAAQQRFGGPRDEDIPAADAIVVKLGATAMSERALLAQQGEAGRELIAVGTFRLVFRQTEQRWSYLRSVGPIAANRDGGEDWQPAARYFLFHYYKRLASAA
jgi:hypothetical protein